MEASTTAPVMGAATTPTPDEQLHAGEVPEPAAGTYDPDATCHLFFNNRYGSVEVKGQLEAVMAAVSVEAEVAQFVRFSTPEGHTVWVRPDQVISVRDRLH